LQRRHVPIAKGDFAMSSKLFRQFLHDECGSYTLWSLVWFILFLGFGGLAVDVTDAYRNQTLLQATADSAALAAIMSVGKQGEDPVAEANFYSGSNMRSATFGDVLADQDIIFGVWNFDSRTFTAEAEPTNAVRVVTRRAVDNDNPVGMNFLRILALFGFNPIWNVTTEAIAVQGISLCHNNGMIAGRELVQSSQNSYFNNICLHGVQGMLLRNDNYFESGVSTSTTCTDCVGPDGSDPSVNEGWDEAWEIGGENEPLFPLNAYMVDEYVDVLKALPDTADFDDMIGTYGDNYAGWRYLFHDDGSPPDRQVVGNNGLPDTLVPYTVYVVNCNGNLMLPSTPIRNVAIVSRCSVQVPASQTVDVRNVAIIADFDSPNAGINFAGGGKFGHGVCGDGTLELYTTGSSIKFAASGDVSNVRLISAWDIEWSAQANGAVGIHAEAVNDIKLTTQANFGLCANSVVNGPNQFTYRLVL
jgi:Flp pilus assembly protein TadG